MAYELYRARVNAEGSTPAERLEQGRVANFEKFLVASPHQAIFDRVNDVEEYPCVLEPHRQNEAEEICHLLCRKTVQLNCGEVILIRTGNVKTPSANNGSLLAQDIALGIVGRFLVWYWDDRQASGYNRYTLLRLNYEVSWCNLDSGNTVYTSLGHVYGQQDNMLKNELKSRSRSATLYLENLKAEFIVMPNNVNMKLDSYVTLNIPVDNTLVERNYHVTGFDITSTPGIVYVTMDPIYKKDLTPAPTQQPGEDDDDYFFFNLAGGVN